MNKGFETYQWLDQNLDFSKVEYTFVGRAPIEFQNIRMLGAMASVELAETLRAHDVFVFASLRESASNSLLEAMNCGLPVVTYSDCGGNREFTWYSGLTYDVPQDIPAKLNLLTRDYLAYRRANWTLTIHDIARQYLEALGL